jgi:hypothetical protein
MQLGGKVEKPSSLFRCVGDLAAPGARNGCESILGARPRKNQQARGTHSGSANPLPTMECDTRAGGKQSVKALHEAEYLLPRKWNATIRDFKREKVDCVVPTRLRFVFQIKFDDLLGCQQGDDGIQTEFLPRLNFDIEPIPPSGPRENA